jgi:excinuclease ABC subunit C
VVRLSDAPGVYRFRNVHERMLYIGRAVNLRRRVASYRSGPATV